MNRAPLFLASLLIALTALGVAPGAPNAVAASPLPGRDGCNRAHCPEDAVFQAVPLQGLMARVLESPLTFASVLEQGDFGLGGMSPRDGEVIVLDGKPHHAQVDGSLHQVGLSERTAVPWVKRFREDRQLTLKTVPSFGALITQLDAGIGLRNRIHAIRIDGQFDRLKVRNVPRQSPHLVDTDRLGGHVLEVESTSTLRADVDTARSLVVITPGDPLFDNADLTLRADQEAYRRTLRTRGVPESER